jgi:multiple sugar transport system permease protein
MVTFILYPMVKAFMVSFYDANLISPRQTFIGLDNYTELFKDKDLYKSIINTFHYAIIVIPVQTCLALGLALLIWGKFKGIGIFRLAYFLPYVIPLAVVSTVFRLVYNKDYGLLNVILGGLGLHRVDVLSNENIAMYGVMTIGVWAATGFFMVVYLAGLNNIPHTIYEAALIDGANVFQRFFRITLPMLRRTTTFVIVITTMEAMKVFVPVQITYNGGGPGVETRTLVYFIYHNAFREMNIGYSSAAAILFFIIVFTFSLIQLKLLRSKDE